jgi:hypothetical protein
MSDGTISRNTADIYGGGVFVNSDGAFTMSNGTISSNNANYGGGGVYSSGTFNMADGMISDNTATTGGGVYVNARFEMCGGTIFDNTVNPSVDGGGGAVYVNTGGTFEKSNTATVGPDTTHLASEAFINVTSELTEDSGVKNIVLDNIEVGTKVVQLFSGAEEEEYLKRFTLHPVVMCQGRILIFNDGDISPTPQSAGLFAPITPRACP